MNYITHESELKIGAGITALYFYADWLLFHKKMMIMIDKVEKKHNIKFLAVDIESFNNTVKRFKIESIPTIIIMKDNGLELKRIVGLTMTSAFKKVFADIYEAYEESKGATNE